MCWDIFSQEYIPSQKKVVRDNTSLQVHIFFFFAILYREYRQRLLGVITMIIGKYCNFAQNVGTNTYEYKHSRMCQCSQIKKFAKFLILCTWKLRNKTFYWEKSWERRERGQRRLWFSDVEQTANSLDYRLMMGKLLGNL